MKSRRFLIFLNTSSKIGSMLGIFLWCLELGVIGWYDRNRLLQTDNIVRDLCLSCVLYLLFGIFLALIINFVVAAFQLLNFNRKRIFSSPTQIPFISGTVFWVLTMINVYYIWLPNIVGNTKHILVAIAALSASLPALLLGYFIYKSIKVSQSLFNKSFSKSLKYKNKATQYLPLILLISLSIIIVLDNFVKISWALKNNNSVINAPPSIILILIDTLRADHLSILGHHHITTPNINRLAEHSIIFTNAYTPAPWTRPAVASLITSMYPSSHSMNGGKKMSDKGQILLEDAFTIPEYLRYVGYYTVGFNTNASVTDEFGYAQGYDEYHYLNNPIVTKFTIFLWVAKAFNFHLNNTYYVNAKALVNKVSFWLADNQWKPFFLYLHFMDPHRPYLRNPQKLWNKTDTSYQQELVNEKKEAYLNTYQGEIAFVDYHIGRIITQLQEFGIYDNSVIIVLSDHGEEFFEHGGWDHGHTLYEELLRVPLLIKLPHQQKSTIDNRLVNLIDIYPTIIKILGFDIPSSLQGVPLISRKGEPLSNNPFIFSERLPAGKGDQAVRDTDWKFILSYDSSDPDVVRTMLFDLKNDPEEKCDLSEKQPALVKYFSEKIDEISEYALNNSIKTKTKSINSGTIQNLKTLGYIK